MDDKIREIIESKKDDREVAEFAGITLTLTQYDYLIEQAERVEELEGSKYRQDLIDEHIERLEKQNKRYEQTLEYIQRAIYTQHCTKNHKWNTEFEKGQISGLIQASNIVAKAIKDSGKIARQALEANT